MTRKIRQADPAVTPQLVKQHGLTPEEFDRIKKILGASRTSPSWGFLRNAERALFV